MKLKRIFCLLLAVLFAFLLLSCNSISGKDQYKKPSSEYNDSSLTQSETPSQTSSTPSDSENGNTPLLYCVSNSYGNKVYVFGSVHVGFEDTNDFPQYVLDAFYSSDKLAVEFDTIAAEQDQMQVATASMSVMYTDGSTIRDHISKDLYDRAVKVLKDNGGYNLNMEYFMPFMWSSVIGDYDLANTGISSENGVDVTLLKMAYNRDMIIYDIESLEEQFTMMGGFSEGLQEYMLENTLSLYGTGQSFSATKMLIEAWEEGDAATLEQLAITDTSSPLLTDQQKLWMAEYNRELLYDRNKNMTDYVELQLNSGQKTFICVGAAHVIGNEGIIAEMRSKGYTVTQVK